MALWKLTAVLARCWKFLLVGALLTATAGLLVAKDQGVYYSRTTIVFLAPKSSSYPNALRTQSDDVIAVAGVVAQRVSGPNRPVKYASPDVTLLGIGVRDGWMLQLPDTGGQWATNFATQTLVLEVVGPTSAVVEDRRDALILRVQQELGQFQHDLGVAQANRVTALPAPESGLIYHAKSNRSRALGMTALLGIGVTGAAVLASGRRRSAGARVVRGVRSAAAGAQ